MKIERTEEEQAAHDAAVEALIEQWGEDFRSLAESPRLTFDGDVVVIRLWKPIKVSNEDATELRMREPTVSELRKVDSVRGSVAQAVSLIVACCSITEREANAIGMRDLTIIGHLIAAFTGAVLGIGSRSSPN